MAKFRTMWQYMSDGERYIPEDSGECIVQPDLSLSPKEIMERWVRNQPLDIVTRNGSFLVECDPDSISDADFTAEDLDTMDMVDAEEYLMTRNIPNSRAPRSEASNGEADMRSESAEPSEPSDNGAG